MIGWRGNLKLWPQLIDHIRTDKSDVRVVVHKLMPSRLEVVVQELGKAGRDNETAQCYVWKI